MTDLATAFALVLVLEGLLWAVSPSSMKRAAATALGLANELLGIGGVVGVAIGVFLVWLVRGCGAGKPPVGWLPASPQD